MSCTSSPLDFLTRKYENPKNSATNTHTQTATTAIRENLLCASTRFSFTRDNCSTITSFSKIRSAFPSINSETDTSKITDNCFKRFASGTDCPVSHLEIV